MKNFVGEVFIILNVTNLLLLASIQIFYFKHKRCFRVSQLICLILLFYLIVVVFLENGLCYLIFCWGYILLLLLIRFNVGWVCIILLPILLLPRTLFSYRILIHCIIYITSENNIYIYQWVKIITICSVLQKMQQKIRLKRPTKNWHLSTIQ